MVYYLDKCGVFWMVCVGGTNETRRYFSVLQKKTERVDGFNASNTKVQY